ncbi:MAG: 16S rRNA (cytosine(967)-C(5))-methyltransferase RsmB [Burkholderiales bacterium]|nr:16S rRNA (cytosine(967)-C(5))-methyltransferase RsmB [Burkholderiales bacterium]
MRGRPRRRRDLRRSRGARAGAGQDRARRPGRGSARGGGASGDGADDDRQPAGRRRAVGPVRDPSADARAHRAPAGDGARLSGPSRAGTSANLAAALAGAATALAAVMRGRALDDALAEAAPAANAPLAAAQRDIAYSACRRLDLLDHLAGALLRKPNRALDALARVALSELIDHPERAHTIVDQAVQAMARDGGSALRGVLNAILRRFIREREALLAAALAIEPIRLGYPDWWIARVRAAWPDLAEDVLAAGNARAPMTVRTNRRRTTADEYARALDAAGIAAAAAAPGALTLARPCPVARLPGFEAGLVSVQDLGAQLAAPLLEAGAGMRVLDACAAPGGKTAHLLESADCAVTAIDRDAARLAAVAANLGRLGLEARLVCADAGDVASWWDGQPFDRILLDAPCTASGVIRRHPDGKWLKRAGDLTPLCAEQARLLDGVWRVLRPGGKLLYATCSIFPDENQRQAARFLNLHPDALPLPIDLGFAHGAAGPLLHRDGQLLPCARHDGFYYALFQKA